ncbi:hypothetical protein GCM10012276_00310 [Nocardioides deserti]|nr:hypothetical protein GCM10012276_00310 [Nocardioides deserti]
MLAGLGGLGGLTGGGRGSSGGGQQEAGREGGEAASSTGPGSGHRASVRPVAAGSRTRRTNGWWASPEWVNPSGPAAGARPHVPQMRDAAARSPA